MGIPRYNDQPAEQHEPSETVLDYPGRPLEFLQPYIDRGILHSSLAQDILREATEALGEHHYNYIHDERELSFIPEDGGSPLVFGCHVVASVAPGPQSVLWGHAAPLQDVYDEQVHRMLKLAEHDNVPELMEDEAEFDEYFANPDGITRVIAPRVAIAVTGLTGMAPYYAMPTSAAGSRMVLMLEDVNGHLPPLTLTEALVRFPRVFEQQAGGILDWHMAIVGLAEAKGWECHDMGDQVVMEDDGAKATFTFGVGNEMGEGSGRNLSFQVEYKDEPGA